MPLATIATIATIAAAAASLASIGYAAAQGAPKLPNAGSASRKIAEAQAHALPGQRRLAAQEQQGGKGSVFVPKHKEVQQFVKVKVGENRDMDKILGLGAGQSPGIDRPGWDPFGLSEHKNNYRYIPYKEEDWKEGGKYYQAGYDPTEHLVNKKVTVQEHNQDYDFSGYGTADIQGELAKQMADIQLDLGRKYGTQFASEGRREADLADPEGAAARTEELRMIEDQINNPSPVSPLSGDLEERIGSQLKAGSGLDDMSRSVLDSAIERANMARGGEVGAGDVATSMGTGAEGAARRQAAQGKAQAWLASGATPEDIAWKREQQNLSNLGSFVSGRTPQSQFQNLSGAEQGATPMNPGQPLPNQPNNAAALGGPFSVASYQANIANQQPNSWLAGLSGLLTSVGSLNSAVPAGRG